MVFGRRRGDLVKDELCRTIVSEVAGRRREDERLSCSRLSCSRSNEKKEVAEQEPSAPVVPREARQELTQDGRRRLVVRVVIGLEVRVRQRLLDGDALLGVEGEAALEEVDGERVGVGVERLERPTLLEGECAEVVARAVRGDGVEVVESGGSENVEDESELMVVCKWWG